MQLSLSLSLGVADLDKSEKFYRDILGLDVERYDPGRACGAFLLIRCGGLCLVLQPLTVMIARHPVVLQNLERSHPGAGVQLELALPDLDAVLRRLKHRRWSLLYELDDQEHQRREVWVQDPDGYLLVLNEESSGAQA